MKIFQLLLQLFVLLSLTLVSYADEVAEQRLEPVSHAESYIISPENNAEVSSTFKVQFGLKGMGVAPAGTNMPKTGHHHLLIDMEELPDLGKPLAANDNIVHFGAGQTETELTLAPGKHTLQLLLADYVHVPHDPPVISKKITITVK